MAAVLEYAGVTVRRGDNSIVSDVSWTVDSADRWVVLGPNGAGKTTLLSMAAARMHPTTGEVTVLGERLGETNTQDLRVRVGFSSAALADHIPPRELVSDVVMTSAYGVTGRWKERYEDIDEERTANLLSAFGMSDFTDREYGTLSEGERKRVLIARALMPDPEILLLDEPAAGLDLGGREELMRAMTELAGDRRSPAIVMVTHHVEEIPVGFTHAMVMRAGSVVAQGPLKETITEPTLAEAYGMDIALISMDGRYTARGRA